MIGTGLEPDVIDLAEHGTSLLGWGDPEAAALKARVLAAPALVVATPTYKATYTGLLKLFLDQFDAGELGGVVTVPVMTGAATVHALALDVHLVPVLVEIGASCHVRGPFLAGPDVDEPSSAVASWMGRSREVLARTLTR